MKHTMKCTKIQTRDVAIAITKKCESLQPVWVSPCMSAQLVAAEPDFCMVQ